jgi:hypothetical protein
MRKIRKNEQIEKPRGELGTLLLARFVRRPFLWDYYYYYYY